MYPDPRHYGYPLLQNPSFPYASLEYAADSVRYPSLFSHCSADRKRLHPHHHPEYSESTPHIYEELIRYIQDDGADEAFSYLLNSAKKAMDTLRNLLHILTTHTEMKDFGEGDTHNAWDLDTSNYFDKPNPTFVNPSDIEDFPFKK